jgi:hypothetical protein
MRCEFECRYYQTTPPSYRAYDQSPDYFALHFVLFFTSNKLFLQGDSRFVIGQGSGMEIDA